MNSQMLDMEIQDLSFFKDGGSICIIPPEPSSASPRALGRHEREQATYLGT